MEAATFFCCTLSTPFYREPHFHLCLIFYSYGIVDSSHTGAYLPNILTATSLPTLASDNASQSITVSWPATPCFQASNFSGNSMKLPWLRSLMTFLHMQMLEHLAFLGQGVPQGSVLGLLHLMNYILQLEQIVHVHTYNSHTTTKMHPLK